MNRIFPDLDFPFSRFSHTFSGVRMYVARSLVPPKTLAYNFNFSHELAS